MTTAAAAAAAAVAAATTTATTISTFYCDIANCYNGNNSKGYSTLDKNNKTKAAAPKIPSLARTPMTKLFTNNSIFHLGKKRKIYKQTNKVKP
ncbi:hypothetical protein PoB_005196700 [Plakobranchus ocellatus]|uniref:Secreted protein n=1 Tax=Plakobranchus ocellatus TaxID=259542 RepID=A0AAV4C280_9GAST|nr:hypothetical protein PoB_005196700 [Plakobranchus ocellatus]